MSLLIRNNWLSRSLIAIWIATASWSGILRPVEFLSIPMLILVLAGFLTIFRTDMAIGIYKFVCVIVLLCILQCVHVFQLNYKTFNYLIVYSGFFLALFLIYHSVRRKDYAQLLQINYISVWLVVACILLEIFSPMFLGIDLVDFLPRSKDATATIDGVFKRAYGFSTEPTQLANYLITAGFIALYYNHEYVKNSVSMLFLLLFALSILLTFSTAAFVILAINVFLICLLNVVRLLRHLKLYNIKKNLAVGLVLLPCAYAFVLSIPDELWNSGVSKVLLKLSLNSESTSGSQRIEMLQVAYNLFLQDPFFGVGLGYMSSSGMMSPINWYAFILAEGGVVSAILIFGIVYLLTRDIAWNRLSRLEMLAITNGFLYLMFISTYYSMGLWVVMLLAVAKSK